MPEREHKPYTHRTLSLLHQFTRHSVDRCDMVGIDCMAKPETVSKKRGTQKNRISMKCDQSPEPCPKIEHHQHGVNRDDLGFRAARLESQDHRDLRHVDGVQSW